MALSKAVFESGSKTYFFVGSNYLRVTRTDDIGPGKVDSGYPKPISKWNWPAGFADRGIEAAFRSGSKTYFFTTNQYIRVTRTDDTGPGKVDSGYPKPISKWNWPAGFPWILD